MKQMISVQNLTKRFDGLTAVDSVEFNVRRGEIFGFLGPNGAGKTTTINMLTGLARPDSGFIQIAGIDCTNKPKAAQHLIGVIPDDSNLYPELTGFENLCFCAALYGMRKKVREAKARKLLETFGLTQAANRKFGGYSKGMKRKLTIAAGIIHEPAILFLDEPTTGIDVASARQIRQLIADLHHTGTTIFLTTHYIEEAERLCERIAFIVHGRIVRIDATSELLEQTKDEHVIELTLTHLLSALPPGIEQEFAHITFQLQAGNKIRAITKTAIPLAPLIRFLEEHGIMVTEARAIQPSLEEVFVRITGIEAGKMKAEKERKNRP